MREPIPRRELFGFRFLNAPNVTAVVDALAAGTDADTARDDVLPLVFTPNVDLLVHLDRHDSPRSTQLVHRAAYVLADGQPVVWASKLLGTPLHMRLAGSSVMDELWPRISADGRHALVLAASEDLAARLRTDHPEAIVIVPPFFDADDQAALEAICQTCFDACGNTVPEYVIAGLSYPKQYTLLDQMIATWPGATKPRLYLAVGAALEMHYGLRPRAPQWVQRIGMEWFHRFAQEPRRLFRRYFIDDAAFVGIVWREYRATRKRR